MMSVNVEKTRCGILYFLGQTKRINLLFRYLCVHLYHVVDAEQSGEISTALGTPRPIRISSKFDVGYGIGQGLPNDQYSS